MEVAVDSKGELYPAVPKMETQVDCSSDEPSNIKNAFNDLLSKLKVSGLMGKALNEQWQYRSCSGTATFYGLGGEKNDRDLNGNEELPPGGF